MTQVELASHFDHHHQRTPHLYYLTSYHAFGRDGRIFCGGSSSRISQRNGLLCSLLVGVPVQRVIVEPFAIRNASSQYSVVYGLEPKLMTSTMVHQKEAWRYF
ncbi:uncharacterized protein PHALS_15049 [Plasmopara halstedii]|uniref:Uncharacterized protein n=1 Tax=Plasmopara halstedii TaxID=4781 RepID=A0A0P1AYW8_PLAHL|nr:uncharacterized protein PHALS_15049 [Plasmopara halstedii]CEG47670.1 hypothetical protein PHALS_15049 [Plasmopara halstedii]|eukprot:XP_024584039.1 hypothetical protein PHALS_15049 [Plasmopara halstedii]